MKAKQIVLATRPIGVPKFEDFRFEEVNVRSPQKGEVMLQPLYVSVDPYMRGRMSDSKSYVPPFELGQPIVGGIVSTVVESNSNLFKKGDTVHGLLPWATTCIVSEKEISKTFPGISPSYHLGIVGMPGLTAYFGLTDICRPKEGETVVVSGAAGAVGTVVGQIAKIKRCRVVGIAGTQEKVELLRNSFGYDEVINYKTEDVEEMLDKYCPNGIDCYYDNVGGNITDYVIQRFNRYARMALCGQISLYNSTDIPMGPRILPAILKTSSLIKGFIVRDYMDRFPEAINQLSIWVNEGQLNYKETIVEGFDNIPKAFIGLFKGSNEGKMIVKI